MKTFPDQRNLWTYLKHRAQASPFFVSVAKVSGGVFVAQVVTVASMPLITRMFTPKEFGILVIFQSILFPSLAAFSGRYEMAVPIPKDTETAMNLVRAAIILQVIFALLILFISGVTISLNLVKHDYIQIIPLISVAIVTSGGYQVLTFWHARYRRYNVLVKTRVIRALAKTVFQTIAGLLHFGSVGLLIGEVLGDSCGLKTLLKNINFFKNFSLIRLRNVMKSYREFPIYTMPGALVNILGIQVPPLLLIAYFGTSFGGQYGLAVRALTIPAMLISQSVAQVYFPDMARSRENVSYIGQQTFKIAYVLFILAMGIFGLIWISSDYLFPAIFGSRWGNSGLVARELIPWMILSFVSSPLSSLPLMFGRQKLAALLTVYETVIRIGAIYVGCILSDPMLAIRLYNITGCIISLIYLMWIFKLAGCFSKKHVLILTISLSPFLLLLILLRVISNYISFFNGIWLVSISTLLLVGLSIWGIRRFRILSFDSQIMVG